LEFVKGNKAKIERRATPARRLLCVAANGVWSALRYFPFGARIALEFV
jgi:hypothetical protein